MKKKIKGLREGKELEQGLKVEHTLKWRDGRARGMAVE